jgi:hypothetical protein
VLPSLEESIDAVIPDWPELGLPERIEVSAHCAGFVRAQLRLAPFHIRVGFNTLFIAYSLYTLLRAGPYAPRSARADALASFSTLPLPMVAVVERILRSMTMLVFFEEPAVLVALGEDTVVARHAAFRAKRTVAEGGA